MGRVGTVSVAEGGFLAMDTPACILTLAFSYWYEWLFLQIMHHFDLLMCCEVGGCISLCTCACADRTGMYVARGVLSHSCSVT